MLQSWLPLSPAVEFELRREIRRLQEYRKAGIKSFCSESTLTFSPTLPHQHIFVRHFHGNDASFPSLSQRSGGSLFSVWLWVVLIYIQRQSVKHPQCSASLMCGSQERFNFTFQRYRPPLISCPSSPSTAQGCV